MYLTCWERIQCGQTGTGSCDSPESSSKINLKQFYQNKSVRHSLFGFIIFLKAFNTGYTIYYMKDWRYVRSPLEGDKSPHLISRTLT